MKAQDMTDEQINRAIRSVDTSMERLEDRRWELTEEKMRRLAIKRTEEKRLERGL